MFGRAIVLVQNLRLYIYVGGKHINKTSTLMYNAYYSNLINSSLI